MKGHVNKCRKARGREYGKMFLVEMQIQNRRARVKIYYEDSPNFEVYRPGMCKNCDKKDNGGKRNGKQK